MRNILTYLLLCFIGLGFAQDGIELDCSIVVNAQQTGNENFPIFKTLEKQLNEFVNSTKWTNKSFENQERINCSMFINVKKYSGESFEASIQVQSSRPVYGSTFTTPLYNFNDENFNFNYIEYQNLIYNPNQFESELISVLAFHINIILGLDADSFAPEGGTPYFKQAQTITNYSQQNNSSGWRPEGGLQNRYALIDNILTSSTYKEYREVMYSYHRLGLDIMSEDLKKGKEQILTSLKSFEAMNDRRPNSFLLRTFFDAKADEIEQIFSDGPKVDLASLKETLQRIAPMHSAKWRKLKF